MKFNKLKYIIQWQKDNPVKRKLAALRYRIKNKSKIKRAVYNSRLNNESYNLMLQFKYQPCCDCNKQYPYYVMDIDHIKGKKLFNLAHSYKYSLREVITELSKCEVICSNCHRERSWS